MMKLSNATIIQDTCLVQGCSNSGHLSRGLCHKHYEHARRNGALKEFPRLRKSPSLFDRLTDRLIVPSADSCWMWKGVIQYWGYGNFTYNRNGKITTTPAHRMAAHLFLGMPLDTDKVVCHKCDVKACCNPRHLHIGTQKENMQDLCAKGLHNTGMHKLTLEQVNSLRKRYADGEKCRPLSKEFGITYHHCWLVCTYRRSWKAHLSPKLSPIPYLEAKDFAPIE